LGVEFLTKVVSTETHRIQLQLWDTAGQEFFRSVTRGYYRGSAGSLIVFDLTSRDSFNSVGNWLKDLKEVARSDVVTVLIGNKSDLETRVVTTEEALDFAEKNGMQYYETSAKSGDNIPSAITSCVLQIEKKVDEGMYNVSSTNEPVNFRPAQKEESGCC